MPRSSTTWIKGQSGNSKGFSAIKRKETAALRKAFRESNDDYLKELHRLIYHAEDERIRFYALQFAIKISKSTFKEKKENAFMFEIFRNLNLTASEFLERRSLGK